MGSDFQPQIEIKTENLHHRAQ